MERIFIASMRRRPSCLFVSDCAVAKKHNTKRQGEERRGQRKKELIRGREDQEKRTVQDENGPHE